MKKKHSTENAFQLGRRSFITSLVAIAMIPISAAVGYYMNKILQQPDLRIVYINDTYFIESQTVEENVLHSVKSNSKLTSFLSETILKLQYDRSLPCTNWLYDGEWVDQCMPVVAQAATGLIAANKAEQQILLANIKALQDWNGTQPLNLQPMREPRSEVVSTLAYRNKAQALGLLQGTLEFLKDIIPNLELLSNTLLSMRENTDTERTGEVEFGIGVLNNGDADGVVFNRGTLKFDEGELWLYSEEYTVVKAHSFQKIIFKIGESEQKDKVSKAWITSVKQKKKLEVQILLRTNADRTFSKNFALN